MYATDNLLGSYLAWMNIGKIHKPRISTYVITIAVPMKHDSWQSCRELSDFWQVSGRLDMNYPDYVYIMHT